MSRILLTALVLIISLIISIVCLSEQKNSVAFSEVTIAHNANTNNNNTSNMLANQKYSQIFETEETRQEKKNKDHSLSPNQIILRKENTHVGNDYDNESIRKFQHQFCGFNAEANSNTYVTEYVLPQTCEMPLGIAVDSDAEKVWYVSTKKGVLGSYNIKERRFDQEYVIPEWSSREDAHSFSQVWDMKVNKKTEDVWFTDEKGNAIWRFIKPSQKFEIYKIPGNSQYFGTIYPISIEFAGDINNDRKDSNDNTIFFVGTYSESLWYANIAKLKNGTSEGIFQIPLPVANEFKGIDPLYITMGSLAQDSKRHDIWICVMAYSKKGVIMRYNLDTKTFNKFELPKEISSPLGMAVDQDSGDLWVTNAGTSTFYKFSPHELRDNNYNISIVKFVTSMASSRIFSDTNGVSNSKYNSDKITNISKHAYTLPYWIKKSGQSIWFNEWEGNKIARFDLLHRTLIEYWIPSQNKLWGVCSSFDNTMNSSENNNNPNNTQEKCGIANLLQFSIEKNNNNDKAKQIWFTEWSENKIGNIDVSDRHLPFSVEVSHSGSDKKDITIKRGESEKFDIKVKTTGWRATSSFSSRDSNDDDDDDDNNNNNNNNNNNIIHMRASGTFTPTGDLGNSTGYFSKNSFAINTSGKKTTDITFVFTPSNLSPGKYTLMIGAENSAISLLRAIQLKIT